VSLSGELESRRSVLGAAFKNHMATWQKTCQLQLWFRVRARTGNVGGFDKNRVSLCVHLICLVFGDSTVWNDSLKVPVQLAFIAFFFCRNAVIAKNVSRPGSEKYVRLSYSQCYIYIYDKICNIKNVPLIYWMWIYCILS
jgi:hypothetical protein